jgi:hypothetical protein
MGIIVKEKGEWGVLLLEKMIPFVELANVPYIH